MQQQRCSVLRPGLQSWCSEAVSSTGNWSTDLPNLRRLGMSAGCSFWWRSYEPSLQTTLAMAPLGALLLAVVAVSLLGSLCEVGALLLPLWTLTPSHFHKFRTLLILRSISYKWNDLNISFQMLFRLGSSLAFLNFEKLFSVSWPDFSLT